MRPRLLFLLRRVGPYHDARFAAAGRRLDLVALETRPGSQEYPWTTLPEARTYRLASFRRAAVPEDGLRGKDLVREVTRALEVNQPTVVATAGWADPEYHLALRWCHRRGVPVVVMSDSTYEDEPRRGWRELVKGMVVRNFAAAVAAGDRSRNYLAQLGFARTAIFRPWDVVDNDYFAQGAAEVRRSPPSLNVPPRRFLCVARFIPKKNLSRLLVAYAGYVAQAGSTPWMLTLSGSGPLEKELRAQAATLGVDAHVEFAGFRQYPELPALYGQAGALILPSTSDQWGLVVNEAMAARLPVLVSSHCGCAPDLVREGENGWTFDPLNTGALQLLMARAAALDADAWRAMGQRSADLVAAYSPEAFATALTLAAETALARRSQSPLARLAFGLMARRHA